MSQSTAKTTYQAVGNREDLSDVITNISPQDTPFLSTFGRVKVTAVTHEWLTDSLASAADNAQIEAVDYTFTRPASRTRLSNWVQDLTTLVEVSDRQRAIMTAGLEDEFAYQMAKKAKEHARDTEYALVNGTGNSGASGTASRLKGVVAFVATNTGTGTALTEADYNTNLQTIWAAGGMPDTTYVNGTLKKAISAFTGGSTKNVDAAAKKLIASVDVYDSDFGRIKIVPHRFLATGVLVTLQNDLWKVGYLTNPKKDDVAKIGSATRAVITSRLTLECRAETGNGKITIS